MSILDFPKEIQSEIFTFAHRDNSNDETLLLPVEVILSHVCSEWRNIAINLPFLWTAFKFETCRRGSPPVEKLQEYLVRSKIQLLELYFDMYARDSQGLTNVLNWSKLLLLTLVVGIDSRFSTT